MIAITTPCIKVCAPNRATGWCFGCGRTITHWFSYSAEQRNAIGAELPARLAALGLPPGGDFEEGRLRARQQRLAAAPEPAA